MFDQEPRERCVSMTTKSAFLALRAPTSPAWVHRSSDVAGLHCQNQSKVAILASTRSASGGCRPAQERPLMGREEENIIYSQRTPPRSCCLVFGRRLSGYNIHRISRPKLHRP